MRMSEDAANKSQKRAQSVAYNIIAPPPASDMHTLRGQRRMKSKQNLIAWGDFNERRFFSGSQVHGGRVPRFFRKIFCLIRSHSICSDHTHPTTTIAPSATQ